MVKLSDIVEARDDMGGAGETSSEVDPEVDHSRQMVPRTNLLTDMDTAQWVP